MSNRELPSAANDKGKPSQDVFALVAALLGEDEVEQEIVPHLTEETKNLPRYQYLARVVQDLRYLSPFPLPYDLSVQLIYNKMTVPTASELHARLSVKDGLDLKTPMELDDLITTVRRLIKHYETRPEEVPDYEYQSTQLLLQNLSAVELDLLAFKTRRPTRNAEEVNALQYLATGLQHQYEVATINLSHNLPLLEELDRVHNAIRAEAGKISPEYTERRGYILHILRKVFDCVTVARVSNGGENETKLRINGTKFEDALTLIRDL